jgi:hypothetical protein
MMIYLRKHQKKLLVVVTVMIIASFTFFGAATAMQNEKIPNRRVGKALDGTPIQERELQAMIRFLSLGHHDALKESFMETGLLVMLAEKYFPLIQDDFQERLEKARRFVPTSSATYIWSRLAPELRHHLDEVKQGAASPQTFAIYSQLYLDQLKFPPETLSQILQYHGQYQPPQVLALFGFQSFEEWFGPRFTELVGKFFFNGAVIAEERGYRVTSSEAHADLLRLCVDAISSKEKATFADAGAFLRLQAQMAGIDETEATKIWKKVMLVHRLFNEVGQGIFADPLIYREFAEFAQETATVESYHLPADLQLSDFRSLLKLQSYLEAVAPKWKHRFAEIPEIDSVIEIEKRAPEFVVSLYTLEVAKVSQEEITGRLTLKETWDFETSDAGWNRLKGQFSALAGFDCKTGEERLQKLDQLPTTLRLKVDHTARSLLLEKHPEWIEEALVKAESKKQTIAIRSRGHVAPFDEIEETDQLRDFLAATTVGEPSLFTHDHQKFYRITVLEKPERKEVLTFGQALQDDWLGQLLDRRLKEVYEKERERFKKPFEEVRDQVGAYVFSDLLKQLSDKTLPLQEYPDRRFVQLMQAAQKKIAAGDRTLLETTGNPLQDQWKLAHKTQEIERSRGSSLSKTEMFTLKPGEWSSVLTCPSIMGDINFFRLVKREKSKKPIDEELRTGQNQLGLDARRLLMHQILEKYGLE